MSDPTLALCNDVLENALAQHGVPEAGPALCALLWLLRDDHREAVTAAARQAYLEGFEWPNPTKSTVAEHLRDRAAHSSSMPWPEAIAEKDKPIAGGCAKSIPAAMQVVAVVLKELIPLWDLEAMEEATAVARRPAEVGVPSQASPPCEPARMPV